MPLAEVIHEIRLNNKNLNFFEKLYFFDEKYFSKDVWKIENFKKSLFSKIVEKTKKHEFFEKSWLFEIFDFSKNFEKVDFL